MTEVASEQADTTEKRTAQRATWRRATGQGGQHHGDKPCDVASLSCPLAPLTFHAQRQYTYD